MQKPIFDNSPSVRLLVIDENSLNQRLDNFLIRELKGVPKTHIYRIIRSGEVRVNKGRAQADDRLALGDVVRLPPVRVSQSVVSNEKNQQNEAKIPIRSFEILFEDDHLLAILKPSGVAVHGGSGVDFGVIEQLRQTKPEQKFLELVHRLDRETSGILLIAKKRSALTHLQNQFRERETGKIYLALVQGNWKNNQKVLDSPLCKYLLPNGERRVKVVDKSHSDAMKSITLVKKLQASEAIQTQNLPSMSLLQVTIKTGRTHQIRVHLAHAGHPILGDDKYGDFELNKRLQRAGEFQLKRLFLHAWQLEFNHPSTNERIQLKADLPEDLSRFWSSIEKSNIFLKNYEKNLDSTKK